MASLNLMPNPGVFLVQTGLFLANVFVVKKLMLDPYLKVKAKRDALTVGGKADASTLMLQNEKNMGYIKQRVDEAFNLARQQSEKLSAEANKKRDDILVHAEKDAKAFLAQAQQEISAELLREKAKIPAIVKDLTENLYQKTIH